MTSRFARTKLRHPAMVLALMLFVGLSSPLPAQELQNLTDAQVEAAADLAAGKAGVAPGSLEIHRRKDLEDLLSAAAEDRRTKLVSFYEIHALQATSRNNSSWVVAAAQLKHRGYDLYSFENPADAQGSLREFNRLASDLALSIPESQAASFAKLALASSDMAQPGQIIQDEDALRVAVENYYYATFGDVWRALDAYVWWWRGFQATSVDPRPTTGHDENGRYHISLMTLLTNSGKHPEIQRWNFEVSREGEVRILAMHQIFPEVPRWLFFDSF